MLALVLLSVACGEDPGGGAGPERAGTTMPGTSVPGIDAYGEDPTVISGSRDEVCRDGNAANRTGRARLAAHIKATWPAVLKVQGYECREILDTTNPACDRESAPEQSTCWSTHAAGRAIDVLVGGRPDDPTPEGVALGDEIVTAFLRPVDGVDHHLARITGVQEIIWNRHCWHPADVGVTSAAAMRPCPIPAHSDHVHLSLSNAGADGQTSWYRAPAG